MEHLQILLEQGWQFEVRQDGLDLVRKFHAQIFHQKRGSGHHYLGETLQKAMDGLEGYVASQGKRDE